MRVCGLAVTAALLVLLLAPPLTPARELGRRQRTLRSLKADPQSTSGNAGNASTDSVRAAVRLSSELQAVLAQDLVHKLDSASKAYDTEHENSSSKSGAAPGAQHFDVPALESQLKHLLIVAHRLLLPRSGCDAGRTESTDSNIDSGSSNPHCHAMAPELLHTNTAAFLGSIMQRYPSGPSSPGGLLSWAGESLAFLDAHHQRQIAQRAAVEEADEAIAPVVAATLAAEAQARAERKAAAKAARRAADAIAAEEGGDQEGSDYSSNSGRSLQQLLQREGSLIEGPGSLAPSTDTSSGAVEDTASAPNDGLPSSTDPASVPSASSAASGSPAPPLVAADFSGPVALGGLPVVRRVLLTQLLLGWLGPMGRELPEGEEAAEALTRLIARMYDIHAESVVQRGVMEYFHISKAGGTSWNEAAGVSGCRRCKDSGARVGQLDDTCRWLNATRMHLATAGLGTQRRHTAKVCSRYGEVKRASRHLGCVKRLNVVRKRALQYISNEYTLHGGQENMYDTHICPQFVNVINIREPHERLLSHLRYMLVRLAQTHFHQPPGAELFRRLFCDAPASRWEEFAPPVVDNYNIRTLVGERAFHSPLYGIRTAHEALAKELLLQYDLVLDLGSGDAASDLVMRGGLGWNCTLAQVHIWTTDRHASRGGLDLEACGLGDVSPLLERQGHDLRWYRFGQALSRLDQLLLAFAGRLGLHPAAAAALAGDPGDLHSGAGEGAGAGVGGSQADSSHTANGSSLYGACGMLGARRRNSNGDS